MVGGPYRSTGLAVMPVGEWIVALRMSANTLTAEQLDAQMLRTIAAIRWPAPTEMALTPATPVKACAAPLTFGKAKPVKPNVGDLLTSLIAGSVEAKARAEGKAAAGPHPI